MPILLTCCYTLKISDFREDSLTVDGAPDGSGAPMILYFVATI